MKRFITLILLTTISSAAIFAAYDPAKFCTDTLYLELLGGFNYPRSENTDREQDRNFFEMSDPKLYKYGFQFSAGQEFHPFWGWRASLGFNDNMGKTSWWTEDYAYFSFINLDIVGDITFDISEFIQFKDIHRRPFNIWAFAGVGFFPTFTYANKLNEHIEYNDKPHMNYGFRAGLHFDYKVLRHLSVCAEWTNTCITDDYNGVVNGVPLDYRMNISIGFKYNFFRQDGDDTLPDTIWVLSDTIWEIQDCHPDLGELPLVFATLHPQIQTLSLYDSVDIKYPVNKTELYTSYQDNPAQLARVRNRIEEITSDSLLEIQHIKLHGYASPEGPYNNNVRLASSRVNTFKDYVQNTIANSISAHNHPYATEITYDVQFTPENWEGLRQYVVSSNTLARKDTVLAIIDLVADPDYKNDVLLRSIDKGETYKFLLDSVYPSLRNTYYTIDYIRRNHCLAECLRLMETAPDQLLLDEYFIILNSKEYLSHDYYNALLVALQYYPDNEALNLNAACYAIASRNYTTAEDYLTKAGNSPQTLNAKGLLAALQGDYEKAEPLLVEAVKGGVTESAELLIKVKERIYFQTKE